MLAPSSYQSMEGAGTMAETNMSEWQRNWFATGKANFETRTGKSMDQWVAIARTCPETGHRARLKWFKEHHGLLQNSASWVLSAAFPTEGGGWDQPDRLRAALWTDPASAGILEAIERVVTAMPEQTSGQRKGYSAWSRRVQFAAIRPARGGTALLGLAVEPDVNGRLRAARNEVWSERLRATLPLATAADVDGEVADLLKQAWERS
jgi:hypothetical protein